MQYTPPLDSADPNAGYVNADPANGREGSKIPAAALENPQREIVAAIAALGLTPAAANNQLATALAEIAASAGYYAEDEDSVADAYVLSPVGSVSFTTPRDGQSVRFTVVHTNTGAATADVCGSGAKLIKKLGGSASLAAGDLTAGAVVELCYVAASSYWELAASSTANSDSASALETELGKKASLNADNVFTSDYPLILDITSLADNSATPAANTTRNVICRAADDSVFGYMGFQILADGKIRTDLFARKKVNGTEYNCRISAQVNDDGTPTTYARTPAISSNTTEIATTAYVNNKLKVVSALPSSPDTNTFYFITA